VGNREEVSALQSFTITPRDSSGTAGPVAPVAQALVQAIPGARLQRVGTLANVATVLLPGTSEAAARSLLGPAWSLDHNATLGFGDAPGPGPTGGPAE
jgi:hypothetical protein